MCIIKRIYIDICRNISGCVMILSRASLVVGVTRVASYVSKALSVWTMQFCRCRMCYRRSVVWSSRLLMWHYIVLLTNQHLVMLGVVDIVIASSLGFGCECEVHIMLCILRKYGK